MRVTGTAARERLGHRASGRPGEGVYLYSKCNGQLSTGFKHRGDLI